MTPYWDNGPVQLYQADARSLPLADQSVHCVVTSPPYFGLRVYKDNDDRGIGLESTVEDYIGNLVDVFREVRRVLRDDGVAWLNLGDSYASDTKGTGGPSVKQLSNAGSRHEMTRHSIDVTSGNRLGIPERVVLALQADGWTWRDTVIWAKKSAMPESLAGWRWERCRVKVAPNSNSDHGKNGAAENRTQVGFNDRWDGVEGASAQYEPCPGCAKCSANDGLVLRKGSWRTTSSHEYIYMLTKGMGYYADGEAVRTPNQTTGPFYDPTFSNRGGPNNSLSKYAAGRRRADDGTFIDVPGSGKPPPEKSRHNDRALNPSGANRRSVWNDISPEPYGGSHFATFPSDLPRICIQASTSEAGCCSECGAQWARVVGSRESSENAPGSNPQSFGGKGSKQTGGGGQRQAWLDDHPIPTLGWRPTCGHDAPAVPALVLDPFAGTFTTGLAAQRLGRRAVGTDISEAYLQQAVKRLEAVSLPLGT